MNVGGGGGRWVNVGGAGGECSGGSSPYCLQRQLPLC